MDRGLAISLTWDVGRLVRAFGRCDRAGGLGRGVAGLLGNAKAKRCDSRK
jgi:hypothetical protein